MLFTLCVLLLGCGRGGFEPYLTSDTNSPLAQECEIDSLRALSFNIYFGDGPQNNSWWFQRRPLVIKMIEEIAPQLIAFQEMRFSSEAEYDPSQQWLHKMMDMRAAFPNQYEVIPEVRPTLNHEGIYGDYIFYDSGRLQPLGYEIMPVVDPTTGQNILCPAGIYAFERYTTWAWFLDIETGKTFHVLNVHLCVSSDRVRSVHAISLMQKIAEFGEDEEVYVFGDFNTTEGSAIYQYLTGSGMLDDGTGAHYAPSILMDSFREVYPAVTSVGTNNEFSDKLNYGADGRRIDYVFTKNVNIVDAGIDNDRLSIPRNTGNATFPSDHYGVYVETEDRTSKVVCN